MSRRELKINKNMQKILMEYLMRKKKGSFPGFISVKETAIARDMKSAKVFLSVMSEKDCSEEVHTALERERYFIQKAVASALRMKFCPRLNFFINHVPYTLHRDPPRGRDFDATPFSDRDLTS